MSSVHFGSIETLRFGIEAKQPKQTVSKQNAKTKKTKTTKKTVKTDTLDLAKWLERLNAKAKVATVLSLVHKIIKRKNGMQR